MAYDSVKEHYSNTGSNLNLRQNGLLDMVAHDHVCWITSRLYKLSDPYIDWKYERLSLGPPKRKLELLTLPWTLSCWSIAATPCSCVSASGCAVLKSVLLLTKSYKAMQPFMPLMRLMLKIFNILCHILLTHFTNNSKSKFKFVCIISYQFAKKNAHAMIAQLLFHKQNNVAIISFEFTSEQN